MFYATIMPVHGESVVRRTNNYADIDNLKKLGLPRSCAALWVEGYKPPFLISVYEESNPIEQYVQEAA